MPALWIGIDVGGTFTDVVGVDLESLQYWTAKVPSSSTDPAGALDEGISELLSRNQKRPSDVQRVIYGTTVALNVLLERKGATVSMITTKGFKDVVEIGRMLRDELYDIMFDKPKPLVARHRRYEVDERVNAAGEEVRPLKSDDVQCVLDQLTDAGPESLAVCFLHAYANEAHEQHVGDAVKQRFPGLPVSLSSEVSPEYSEYERFATTVLNSYLMPKTRSALGSVADRVASLGISAPVEVMQSNGGITTTDVAARFPVRLLGSGPVGGVAGAVGLSAAVGVSNLITLDMGGTSTDVCLVTNGVPSYTTQRRFEGQPVRTLMTDVQSIGTGGGSIARVDVAGSLQVGPDSAGADPGPICYGRGGRRVTVTDADVLLGYLNPERFLGGKQRLDAQAASAGLRDQIASPTDTGLISAALGVVTVAVNNMVGALRRVTTQRGHDPRDFTLVAFGGAGPVHAGLLAREVGIPRVLAPAYPGLLSARGLLLADLRTEASLTLSKTLDSVSPGELTSIFERLEGEARSVLPGGSSPDSLEVERLAEMCYQGQRHELPVPFPAGGLTGADLDDASRRLDESFIELYGFLPISHTPQIVHLRVFLRKRIEEAEKLRARGIAVGDGSGDAQLGERRLYFDDTGEAGRVCPVYDRSRLGVGRSIVGPAVVEEDYSTTMVYPGQSLTVDDHGNLVIDTGVTAQ